MIALVIAAIIVLIGLNLLLFAGIVVKKLLRDAFVVYREYLKRHYLELIEKALASEGPLKLDLSERERKKNQPFIEEAIRISLQRASPAEKNRLKSLFINLNYLHYRLTQLKSRRPLERAYAAEILGAFQVDEAVEPLIEALGDSTDFVRSTTVRALGKIGGEKAVAALAKALVKPKLWMPVRIAAVLGEVGEAAVPYLISALKAADGEARALAAQTLGRIREARAVPALIESLKDKEIGVRAKAIEALGETGDRSALPHLRRAIFDSAWPVRAMAAKALGYLRDVNSAPLLAHALTDPEWWVRTHAAQSLIDLGIKGEKTLISALSFDDRFARERATEALELAGVVDRYIKDLISPNPEIVATATKILLMMGRAGAIAHFQEVMKEKGDSLLQKALQKIIDQIGQEKSLLVGKPTTDEKLVIVKR